MHNGTRLFFAFLSIVFFNTTSAAPKADLWEFWDASDPASTRAIDHGAWDNFLATYVKRDQEGINRVSYANVSDQDKSDLEAYLGALSGVAIRTHNKSEQLAYWINLYNAVTIKVVLDHYPVQSIKDIGISPGLFSVGPWGRKLVEIEGEPLSLDDIEHRILRPIWKDPRIHYAVNCASIGCPNLALEAYTAANTERLLQQGAADYINHSRGVTVTRRGLTVSKIYDWFMEDFGGDEEGIVDHLLEFADTELAGQIRSSNGIDRYRYDWSLNGVRQVSLPFKRPES